MKFYEYKQNNSGGSFVTNDKLCHRLFIEADSISAANEKARSLGVYFDGCASGNDCSCCGDRWYPPYEALEFPYTYGTLEKETAEAAAEKYKLEIREAKTKFRKNGYEIVFDSVDQYARYVADNYGWTTPDARIYYANGAVLSIESEKL
jgi:hypothetical protein